MIRHMNAEGEPKLIFTDFHSHMIPKMDDGSTSVEMSLEMIRRSLLQGVRRIVLTPHFYPGRDYPDHFLAKRSRQMALLTEGLKGSPIQLVPGAEIRYFDGITAMSELPLMRLGESDALLIEMPFCPWTARMVNDILALSMEYHVVLAHIERYLPYINLSTVRHLAEEGVMMQANAEFFTGFFQSRRAIRMLEKGFIHLLGSDAHNLTSRPPNLSLAIDLIRKKCGEGAVKSILACGDDLLRPSGREAGSPLEGVVS